MKPAIVVFSVAMLLLSACSQHNPTHGVGEINTGASLPADFNFSKAGFKVICSTINKTSGTMATLYGNDSAKATAQAGNGKCASGAIFALVTWKQQPDKRWIGGNIPGQLLSIEILKASTGQSPAAVSYNRFTGPDLKADADTTGENARTIYIVGLKPSVMF